MSAIFGILALNGQKIDADHVSKMKAILSSYGLDAEDTYSHGNIAMGSCLNQISIYSQKDTPIQVDENQKTVLVADALIYNRDELISDYQLTEDGDSSNNALLMAAYKKWGDDCPKYINGDFAMAIWKNDTLTIIRDHLGVRPLYYYHDQSFFVFATDVRAILAMPFVPKKINEKMLYNILVNGEFRRKEKTYFDGIYALLPAHCLTVSKQGLSLKKYWTPGLGNKLIFDSEAEYFKTLYAMVEKSINIRLAHTDMKIGAQMSGGLDSGVINILANRELKKEGKPGLPLFSWAPGFDVYERQKRDERDFIEAICEQEAMVCEYFDIAKILQSNDPDQVKAIEEGHLFVMAHEAKHVRSKNIRLMLSGWGGDQGISHQANPFELFVHQEWHYFFKEIQGLSQGSVLRFMKLGIANTILSFFKAHGLFSSKEDERIKIENRDFYRLMKKYRKKTVSYAAIAPIKRMESGEIQTRTEASAWLGAEHNVQYIFPFLDYQLVDFAMSIPRHLYYKNGINRYIYRKTFEGILPNELCYCTYEDDIARCTYRRSKIKNIETATELLDIKLSKALFSEYIDFNKGKSVIDCLKKKENFLQERSLVWILEFCYNIQKLMDAAVK